MIKFKDNNINWDSGTKKLIKPFFESPKTQEYLKNGNFTALFAFATRLFAFATSYTTFNGSRFVSTVAEILIKSGIDIISNLNLIPMYFLISSNVEAIDIEPNIEIIKTCAFENCTNLKEVNIQGNNLSIIEKYAFSNCNKLKKINFPRSLTAIDRYAFEYCTSLKEITYAGTIEELKQIKHFQKMRSIAHVDSSSIFENDIIFHCVDGDVKYSSGIERWKKL